MKKYVIIFTLLILSASTILIVSCKKDKTAPLIFLNGSSPLNVVLGSIFVDPGATADDNKDGSSLSNKIVVTHNIPITGPANGSGTTTLTGQYLITYTVTDKAGNTSSKSRKVYVVNSQLRFAIDYLVDKTDDNITQDTVSFPVYTNQYDTLSVDPKKNNRIIFPKVCRGITNPHNLTSYPGFLRVYGDVITYTDVNHNKHLYIDIPSQTLRKKNILDTVEYAYQITSIGHGTSSQCNIDTAYNNIADNFLITLRYTIVKLKKLSSTDPTYLRVWEDTLAHIWFGGTPSNPLYYKTAQCTEKYRRQ
jgi:hypothetical protein